jgi:TetR/AcrR family transcriptional regulator, cholesterol catabolism regulator
MSLSRKTEKRVLIREAAARLFAEKGFEKTTTREISGYAGISNAALYYYFDSKEEILYQILDETMSTGLQLISEIAESQMDIKAKLACILRTHAASAVDFHKMKLLVHDLKYLDSVHLDLIRGRQRKYVNELISVLQEVRRKGMMRPLDPKACAFAFFGMVSWAYRWYDPAGTIRPSKLAKIFSEIFTKGIFID